MAVLLDQWGNPVDLKALKEEKAAPSVTGVRSVMTGHPSAGLTPARLARLLREAESGDPIRYLELAEDMEEKDLHYLGVIGTRKRQVAQLDISVEAAGDDQAALDQQTFLEDWLDREGLEDELFDILDAVGKGFSVTEILWDTSAGQWLPSRLEWRDPRWFTFDRVDGTTLQLRDETGQPVDLSPFKFIDHRGKAKSGLPIRGGLARAAAWAYLFKNFDIKGWMGFAEVYGQPLRLGKYHNGATEEEREKLLQAVASIGRDAAAIIPESMMIEFVKSEVRGSSDLYERLANYMDTQVSKAVLGQTTTTDAISGGHSVSKEHNEVREDIERADCKQLAATLNRDLGRPIVDLNFGPQKAYPRIRIGRPEECDTKALTESVSKLVPLGLRVSQREMRDKLRLREPDGDEEILGGPAQGEPVGPEPGETHKAAAEPNDAPRDSVDDLADEADAATAATMTGLIDRLRGLVDAATDMADLSERIAEAYPDMDLTDLS